MAMEGRQNDGVNESLRTDIWNSLLDMKKSVRYWELLCHRYNRRDMVVRVFLALTSSATIMGWQFWDSVEIVWKILCGISAVTAIIYSTLGWQKINANHINTDRESVTDLFPISYSLVACRKWPEFQRDHGRI